MLIVPVALSDPGFLADLIVGIQLPGAHLADGSDFSPEGDLGRGQQLRISGLQGILLLQILHKGRIEGLGRDLGIQERNFSVFFLQLGSEGAFQHSLGPGLEGRLQLGHLLVVECNLFFIEGVTGIDIPADFGEADHGGIVHIACVFLIIDGRGFLKSLGRLEFFCQVFDHGLPMVQVCAFVGDLGKGHCSSLLYICLSPV